MAHHAEKPFPQQLKNRNQESSRETTSTSRFFHIGTGKFNTLNLKELHDIEKIMENTPDFTPNRPIQRAKTFRKPYFNNRIAVKGGCQPQIMD